MRIPTFCKLTAALLLGLIAAVPFARAQTPDQSPPTAQQILQRLQRDLETARDSEAEDGFRAGSLDAVMADKTFLTQEEKLSLLLSLLRTPTSADLALQSWVIYDLAGYGPKSAPAIPALLQILGDTDVNSDLRLLTVRTLAAIGKKTPGVVPALLARLGDETVDPDLTAVPTALGRLGPAARAAVPALQKALRTPIDDNGSSRAHYAAYIALGKISGSGKTVSVAELRQQLQNLDRLTPDQGAAVFLALQAAGHEAAAMAPALVAIMGGKSPGYVRAAAIETLGFAGPSATATSALIQLYREAPERAPDSGLLREMTAAALTRLGPKDPDAVGPLLQTLGETEKPQEPHAGSGRVPRFRDVYLHGILISALARIGPAAAPAAPALISELATAGETERRVQLLQAVLRVGIPAEAATRRTLLTALMPSLQEGEGIEFATAAYAAGALGPEAKALVPLLLGGLASATLDDGLTGDKGQFYFGEKVTSSVRIEAMRALARIGPGAVEAVPRLQEFALGTPLDVDWLPPTGLHEDAEARKALKAIRAE